MQGTFRRVMLASGADLSGVWGSLRDVELLSRCSSAIDEVNEKISGKEWSVVLRRRVGRFSVAAPLTVTVVGESELQWLRVHGRGTDTKIGARLDVIAEMQVEQDESGVRLTLDGSYEMTGRIASLGASIVRRHADEMVDEFSRNLPLVMTSAAEPGGRK